MIIVDLQHRAEGLGVRDLDMEGTHPALTVDSSDLGMNLRFDDGQPTAAVRQVGSQWLEPEVS